MKVKITYTVELEKVLEEVNRLFQSTISTVESIRDKYKDLEIKEESISSDLTQIDQMRKTMYGVDLLLADVDGILRSYMATKFPQPEEQEERKLLNG